MSRNLLFSSALALAFALSGNAFAKPENTMKPPSRQTTKDAEAQPNFAVTGTDILFRNLPGSTRIELAAPPDPAKAEEKLGRPLTDKERLDALQSTVRNREVIHQTLGDLRSWHANQNEHCQYSDLWLTAAVMICARGYRDGDKPMFNTTTYLFERAASRSNKIWLQAAYVSNAYDPEQVYEGAALQGFILERLSEYAYEPE